MSPQPGPVAPVGDPPPGPAIGAPGPYEGRGRALGALVDRKQREYGDSFHRCEVIIRALWPDGIPPAAYTDALAVVRVIDKLFRIAAGKRGEEDPWQDIAGYGLLGAGGEGASPTRYRKNGDGEE